MAVIDFEPAWYDLKAFIASKRSHSAKELAEKMASIEVAHRVPEGTEGFDDRPPLEVQRGRHTSPAHDEPERDLHEPAQVVSAAS